MASNGSLFRCPNGHGLGLVVKNGSNHKQLLLYREAMVINNPDQGKGSDVDVMAVCEGVIMDVRCSICGQVRTWVPGEETLRRLVARVLEKKTNEPR